MEVNWQILANGYVHCLPNNARKRTKEAKAYIDGLIFRNGVLSHFVLDGKETATKKRLKLYMGGPSTEIDFSRSATTAKPYVAKDDVAAASMLMRDLEEQAGILFHNQDVVFRVWSVEGYTAEAYIINEAHDIPEIVIPMSE